MVNIKDIFCTFFRDLQDVHSFAPLHILTKFDISVIFHIRNISYIFVHGLDSLLSIQEVMPSVVPPAVAPAVQPVLPSSRKRPADTPLEAIESLLEPRPRISTVNYVATSTIPDAGFGVLA